MLKPSRLSSLICSTSFPLNKGRPSSVSRFGCFITSGGGNFFNRHYGHFCTGTDKRRWLEQSCKVPRAIACRGLWHSRQPRDFRQLVFCNLRIIRWLCCSDPLLQHHSVFNYIATSGWLSR